MCSDVKIPKRLQIDNTLKYAHWNLALLTMNYIWKSYKKMNEFKIVISNNSLNKKDKTKSFLQKSAHYKSVSISTYLQILKIWHKNDIFYLVFLWACSQAYLRIEIITPIIWNSYLALLWFCSHLQIFPVWRFFSLEWQLMEWLRRRPSPQE